MLILAAVAIKLTINDEGIFKKTQASTQTYDKSKAEEELQLALANAYLENVDIANAVRIAATEDVDIEDVEDLDVEEANNTKIADSMTKELPDIEWVYKTSLSGKYKGYDFTILNKEVKMDVLKDFSNRIVNKALAKEYFWNNDYRENISNIIFKKDNPEKYTKNAVLNENNENKPWDVSRRKNKGILAYLEKIGNTDKYNLYIVSNKTISFPADSSYWFSSFTNLEKINGLENIDTYAVLSMKFMFEFTGNENMTNFDLGSNFNTSNVIDMAGMFYYFGDYGLTTLDLGDKFDTSNVINMADMFRFCGVDSLTTLDLGNKFNTSNVTNMEVMFEHCNKLTSLNLGSKFDTSKVTDMTGMFGYCESMESFNLGDKFNTSNVVEMAEMFNCCKALKTIEFNSNFNTSNVINMQAMFNSCESLQVLNLGPNFDTSNVTNMKWMFKFCGIDNLETLNLGNKFNTSKVTNMESMFENFAKESGKLENIYLGEKFNTSSVTDMTSMFKNCGIYSVQSIDLGPSFIINGSATTDSIFNNSFKENSTIYCKASSVSNIQGLVENGRNQVIAKEY